MPSSEDLTPERARDALSAKRAVTVVRLKGLDDSFTDLVDAARDSNLDDEHDAEGATIAVDRAQITLARRSVSSSLTIGATWVPYSSMACMRFWCGRWPVLPPEVHTHRGVQLCYDTHEHRPGR